ncbi:phospholipase D family protein [Burkholderia gladioli]|uniref:phospholipase D family protein n=1 Tax=Burkholderia gladioli TaxID=28095 RepID=UPI002FE32A82
MAQLIPTGIFSSWAVTSFRDSLIAELDRKSRATELQLFFYAVTLSGWNEVSSVIRKWRSAKSRRKVTIYVGTDHGITDPDALEAMDRDGVFVQLMVNYSGVFHPEVVWLSGGTEHIVWIGSNNLTRDGLANNIEFAAMIRSDRVPDLLRDWAQEVAAGSIPLDTGLLDSYRSERAQFEKHRAAAKSMTFTWSRRTEPADRSKPRLRAGDLILEVMPEETRGGNQVQLPKDAVRQFLGLEAIGDRILIKLKQKGKGSFRNLLVSVFSNNTVRISINELEYRDRPCILILRKLSANRLEFEIVPEAVFPTRYRSLLAACTNQTRSGSRHWVII